MKLSTKGRYAARMMLDLAIHQGARPVLLKDIAKRQEISEKYLGHLISALKSARLITSSRGAHGGYSLARPPRDISLAEVVQAAEGSVSLVECISSPEICSRVECCVTRDLWNEINSQMLTVLIGTTLEDLINRYHAKCGSVPGMYAI